jgi:hypothetical protein
MTLAQRRNRLTTHFSERISVVKRRISAISWWAACWPVLLQKVTLTEFRNSRSPPRLTEYITLRYSRGATDVREFVMMVLSIAVKSGSAFNGSMCTFYGIFDISSYIEIISLLHDVKYQYEVSGNTRKAFIPMRFSISRSVSRSI